MGFWRGETIKSRGGAIIDQFDVKSVDCNAYTLKMGSLFFSTTDGKSPKFSKPQDLATGEIFVIPPGQFAFLRTKEFLTVPNNAMAFISMKATFKFEGLINVSGFHVDPGYRGHLLFAAHNAGPSPIYLREGMDLFLIWFADLDDPATSVTPSTMVRNKEAEKELSRELVQKMGPILSMQSLSEDIYRLNLKANVQSYVFAFAVVFFTTLFFAVFNHWINGPSRDISAPAQAIGTLSNSAVPAGKNP